jgi:hypothetical protein
MVKWYWQRKWNRMWSSWRKCWHKEEASIAFWKYSNMLLSSWHKPRMKELECGSVKIKRPQLGRISLLTRMLQRLITWLISQFITFWPEKDTIVSVGKSESKNLWPLHKRRSFVYPQYKPNWEDEPCLISLSDRNNSRRMNPTKEFALDFFKKATAKRENKVIFWREQFRW